MTALEKYNTRAAKVNSLLCVGLDPEYEKLPPEFSAQAEPQFEFNRRIIEETHPYAAAYKLNIAFYEARGDQGFRELKKSIDYLKQTYPDIPILCDAKRNEVINTSRQYAAALFDWFGFDGTTLNPYLGREPLQPFLERRDKACIILCRTSNPGAGEFQDLLVQSADSPGLPLWQMVAERVRDEWNANGNCMLVVGATYPAEMKKIREITGEMTFLVPGLGVQGGEVEAMVKAGLNKDGKGLICVSARGIIFAADPAAAARELRDQINAFR